MSSPIAAQGAQEILFRTSIAACNSGAHLRVYMQDVRGNIRESLYEDGWSSGTEKNVIASAKFGSPIAATTKELDNIRAYYFNSDNMLMEAAYGHSKGWYEGAIGKSRIMAAPYSKIAACFLPGKDLILRVYVQMPDNTIQEFGWGGDNSNWKKMQNLGEAMPGSGIACTSFKMTDTSIRVYFQDMHGALVERCYDSHKSWYNGSFKVDGILPRTGMACTSHVSGDQVRIHILYVTGTIVREMYWDQKWHEGSMKVNSIPGSEAAVIGWGQGNDFNMRFYFQKGEHVTGISEWAYMKGNWKAGQLALPPA